MDRKRLIAAVLLLFVAACAPRPMSGSLLPVGDAPASASLVPVLAASLRSEAPEGSSDDVVALSGVASHYEALEVSIPPNHKKGKVEAASRPDPATSFAVKDSRAFDRTGFQGLIGRSLEAHGGPGQDVFVFVHGFNTNYPEAVFRMAQLLHDSGTSETSVLVSWPSFGQLLRYSADRERSIYSRDFLEAVLKDIAAQPKVGRVHIVAHSMGAMLAMETVRQASFKGDPALLGKLGKIVLIEPDLDFGVFTTQLDDIGSLRNHITVIVTKDDFALAVSKKLAGGLPRLGNLDVNAGGPVDVIKSRGVRVIDITRFRDCDKVIRHSNYTCVVDQLRPIIAGRRPESQLALTRRGG
jgi:esterase/lipase superfamily enzyme